MNVRNSLGSYCVRIEEERDGDDHVSAHQHDSLKPVGLSVENEIIRDENSHKHHRGLKRGEVQGHWHIENPSYQDKKWRHKQRNLDRGADSNTDSKVHLVFHSHHHRCDVLSRVTDDRNHNQTNKGFRKTRALDDIVDRRHKVVGRERNQQCRQEQHNQGGRSSKMGRLLVAQLVQGSWSAGQETAFGVGVRDICGGSVLFLHHRQLFLVLGFERLVKQKFVSSELEIEIETVHDQQQDRGSSGDFQDFGVQVFCLSWKRCMEGGREQQSTHRQRKQRAHCLSHCLVERLLWVLDTTGDETTSKHQQEVGKNRAKHGSLHNGYLVLTQGQNAHNNFNCISESSV